MGAGVEGGRGQGGGVGRGLGGGGGRGAGVVPRNSHKSRSQMPPPESFPGRFCDSLPAKFVLYKLIKD